MEKRLVSAINLKIREAEWRRDEFASNVWPISPSPDGKWLAVCSQQKRTVSILDAKTGDERWRLPPYKEFLNGLIFSPENWQLTVSGHIRAVQLWSLPAD
jgi:WD40 repeat protein